MVGVRLKKNRFRNGTRFTKEDWKQGPLDDWGWGYAWGYRRAQYHYMERIERCVFGRNRFYGHKPPTNVPGTAGTSANPPNPSPTSSSAFSASASASTSPALTTYPTHKQLADGSFAQRPFGAYSTKGPINEPQKLSVQNDYVFKGKDNISMKSKF